MDTPFNFFTFFIMRGLPGTGKTTIAQAILGGNSVKKEIGNFIFYYCSNGVICSSDFYSSQDSILKSQKSVEFAMRNKVPAIILDEDNLTKWDIEPFISLANKNGYKIIIVEIPTASLDFLAQRNTSGFDKSILLQMKNRWENFNIPGSNGLTISEDSR